MQFLTMHGVVLLFYVIGYEKKGPLHAINYIFTMRQNSRVGHKTGQLFLLFYK